jgi:mannose-6-phosphate isomerase-like protein (cupin superfamily)
VYLVVKGRGRFLVGDERRTLSAGEAVMAPASSPHGIENDGDDRLVVLVFMAPPPV